MNKLLAQGMCGLILGLSGMSLVGCVHNSQASQEETADSESVHLKHGATHLVVPDRQSWGETQTSGDTVIMKSVSDDDSLVRKIVISQPPAPLVRQDQFNQFIAFVFEQEIRGYGQMQRFSFLEGEMKPYQLHGRVCQINYAMYLDKQARANKSKKDPEAISENYTLICHKPGKPYFDEITLTYEYPVAYPMKDSRKKAEDLFASVSF